MPDAKAYSSTVFTTWRDAHARSTVRNVGSTSNDILTVAEHVDEREADLVTTRVDAGAKAAVDEREVDGAGRSAVELDSRPGIGPVGR